MLHNLSAPSFFLLQSWDFHAGTRTMLSQVQFWAPSAFPAIVEKGHLPMDWMQVLFASLAPGSAAKKFAFFRGYGPRQRRGAVVCRGRGLAE